MFARRRDKPSRVTHSEVFPFDSYRRRIAGIAALFVVLAFAGLLYVAALVPKDALVCNPASTAETAPTATADSPELRCERETSSGFELSDPWTTAISTVLGTILAVAIVTLLFEFRLRRSFGNDLIRFLNLKKSLVVSGLSDVDVSARMDTRSTLAHSDEILYVGRTPDAWLNENFPYLLRLGEKHQVHITVSLPDPDNDDIVTTVANGMGVPPTDLAQSIRAFITSAQAQWRAAEPRLKQGTSIRLVHARAIPLFDALHSTGMTGLFLSKPVFHAAADDLLGLCFTEDEDVFPRSWIAAAMEQIRTENEVFTGMKS